jgi:caffeoyl-CoA O-methyltransferase
MRPGGVILVDNVLWGGAIIDPSDTSRDTVALREFNDMVIADARVEVVMLPIADGLTMCRKR